MLKINGKEYSGIVNVMKVVETFEKVYGESSVMKQDGEDWYDTIGTRYIHEITVTKNPSVSAEESDEFFDLISSPEDMHVVTLPHGSGNITYNAHITSGARELIDIIDGEYIWSDDIVLIFRATAPQKRRET